MTRLAYLWRLCWLCLFLFNIWSVLVYFNSRWIIGIRILCSTARCGMDSWCILIGWVAVIIVAVVWIIIVTFVIRIWNIASLCCLRYLGSLRCLWCLWGTIVIVIGSIVVCISGWSCIVIRIRGSFWVRIDSV